MSFETTERIMAVNKSDVQTIFTVLTAQYGEPIYDGNKTIVTIGAHWDDTEKTRIRAASLVDPMTIVGAPLRDERIAFRCLWQSDLAADYDAGKIKQSVEQLNSEQLEELKEKHL